MTAIKEVANVCNPLERKDGKERVLDFFGYYNEVLPDKLAALTEYGWPMKVRLPSDIGKAAFFEVTSLDGMKSGSLSPIFASDDYCPEDSGFPTGVDDWEVSYVGRSLVVDVAAKETGADLAVTVILYRGEGESEQDALYRVLLKVNETGNAPYCRALSVEYFVGHDVDSKPIWFSVNAYEACKLLDVVEKIKRIMAKEPKLRKEN